MRYTEPNQPDEITVQENTEEQLRRELELATQENAQIRATDDFREGLASFLEKRPPKWTGR